MDWRNPEHGDGPDNLKWFPIQGKVIGFTDQYDDPDQDESMLVQDQNTGAIWQRWLGNDFVILDPKWAVHDEIVEYGYIVIFHTHEGEEGTVNLTDG